jgi:hypothetical protein
MAGRLARASLDDIAMGEGRNQAGGEHIAG